ncbi:MULTISPECIES: hypothetical protein [unclassified Anabaena]|uniref:hypothetical protein n=1 Tax=unclassified Anabaena TaxID=2619674 RepID=UPI0008349FF7|nr:MULTISPECIES: hypothetical protein [unclassified Anabaena]
MVIAFPVVEKIYYRLRSLPINNILWQLMRTIAHEPNFTTLLCFVTNPVVLRQTHIQGFT